MILILNKKTFLKQVIFKLQGMEVHGVPEYVVVGGRVCVDECDVKAVHGFGKYVETAPYPPHVYDIVEEREKQPRGIARSEAEARKFAEEDAAFARAREAAKAARAAMEMAIALENSVHQNGNHHLDPIMSRPNSISGTCTPTLPNSAIATPSVKGPRLEGQRNLQDSTFSISGKSLIFFLL